ncbi:MAG: hypothetical protein H7A22_06120 [Spirochaetales bacterium]|nr:hypothetical protein [Spirochaetales bacterium]
MRPAHVTLNEGGVLLAGRTGLTAFRLLERKAIPNRRMNAGKLHRGLVEIEESPVRLDLTALERREHPPIVS